MKSKGLFLSILDLEISFFLLKKQKQEKMERRLSFSLFSSTLFQRVLLINKFWRYIGFRGLVSCFSAFVLYG